VAGTVDPADQAALDPGVPADLDRHPEVLVVGGGVIGLATAVFCRRAGVGRVLVIEAARLAGAASGGAGGALAPALHQLSDPLAFVALARTSLALHRQLDQDWDRALGLEQTAGLLLLPEGPPAGLRPWPGVELLDRDQVAELVPELVSMPAGLLAHDQARVHPLRLAAALARRAGSGATGMAMTDLVVAGGRIVRVRTTAGDLHPGVVVFATGLAPEPWVRVPQRLVKGHLVATEPVGFRLVCGLHSPGLGVGSMADGDCSPAGPATRATTPSRSAPKWSRASGVGWARCSPPPPRCACAASGVASPSHRRWSARDRPRARSRQRLGERWP
jgi:glycine oxidase